MIRLFSAFLAVAVLCASAPLNAQVLYGCSSIQGTNPGSIFTIDVATGVATLLGTPNAPNGLSDVSIDPTTGTMYAIHGAATRGAVLMTIDPATGADLTSVPITSPFGPLAGSDAICHDASGTLYVGAWAEGRLLTLDPATGVALTDMPVTGGGGNNHLADLTVDPTNGEMWASRGGSFDGRIVRLDPATANVLQIVDLPTGQPITAVASAPDGTLYGVLAGDQLIIIDTGTATFTPVGSGFGGPKMSGLGFTTTVPDTTPPTATITLNRDTLWPPNHKLANIVATLTVTDDEDPNPVCVLTSITSNEPDNGTGDGDRPDDIQGAEVGTLDTEFDLRSERSGSGDGRTYTITYTCTDESGNAADAVVAVNVPHDQSGRAKGADGLLPDGTGIDPEVPSFFVVIRGELSLDDGYVTTHDIDPRRARVGNHLGEVAIRSYRRVDVTRDQLQDLVLEYPADETFDLTLSSSGEEEVVAMRYENGEGEGFIVPNIFALGAPLDLKARPPSRDRNELVKTRDNDADPLPQSVRPAPWLEVRPNPFNPATKVSFELAVRQPVRLEVYDPRGGLVRALVQRELDAGRHDVTWNGRDDAGRPASTGVYFFRLVTSDWTQIQKAVLMK